jgi:hypothetical protein
VNQAKAKAVNPMPNPAAHQGQLLMNKLKYKVVLLLGMVPILY